MSKLTIKTFTALIIMALFAIVPMVNSAGVFCAAGEDIVAYSGDEVVLDGTESGSIFGIEKWVWFSDDIVLSEPEYPMVKFIAPDVEESTTFEFRLFVWDGTGEWDDDVVYVGVLPRSYLDSGGGDSGCFVDNMR